jgi:membrane protein
MNGKELIVIARATVREFFDDDVPNEAAALTYYAFFSIFPLLLLAILCANLFLKPEDAQKFILENVAQYAPGSSDLLQEVATTALQYRENTGWLALVGLAALLFTASGALHALDRAINRAWDIEQARSFLISRLLSLVMLAVLGMLLLLSVVVSTVLRDTRRFAGAWPEWVHLPGSPFLWQVANFAASFAIISVGFLVMYRFLPHGVQIRVRDVWPGAVIAALLWVITKEGFALYLSMSFVNYDTVYGTLGTVIALLTWIYLSSLIILVGAEISAETARVRRLRYYVTGQPERGMASSPWLPRPES